LLQELFFGRQDFVGEAVVGCFEGGAEGFFVGENVCPVKVGVEVGFFVGDLVPVQPDTMFVASEMPGERLSMLGLVL
jgi:hypothetical protein